MSAPVECTHVSVSEFDMTGVHIGSGSYSEVSLAVRHMGRVNYAVKVIDKEKAQRRNTVKYVQNEREVMITLNHRYIIKLLHTSRDLHHVFLFYEYCKNGELWQQQQKNKGSQLPDNIALKWLCQVLNGVQYLHLDMNIAHRDQKPENLLLDDTFNMKLIDFGTSKRLNLLELEDKKRDEALLAAIQKFDGAHANAERTTEFESHRRKSIMYTATRGNSFTGTPEYMAPEAAHSKNTRGSAVDLWSLGVLAYQQHTGQQPFQAESPFLVFLEMDKMNVDYSAFRCPLWKDLVQQLLRPDPRQRLGVTTGYDGPVDMNTDQEEQMCDELCVVRNKPTPLPLSKAHVNSTPEGWIAILQHPLFAQIEWSDLSLTEEQQNTVRAIADRRDPTQDNKKVPVSMDVIDAEFGPEVDDEHLYKK